MQTKILSNTKKESSQIGGKASNLQKLVDLGINVPNWIVIPQEDLLEIIPENLKNDLNVDEILNFIDNYEFKTGFIEEITKKIDKNTSGKYFAVRSSAIDEDGSNFSFAGQFESFMYVKSENLGEYIKKVWKSAFSERVSEYRKINKLKPQFGIAVIIQEMINSEISGVAFGIDPTTGNTETKIISAVYGLGEGIVSGDLDADTFKIKNGKIEKQIAEKTHYYTQNIKSGGIIKLENQENRITKSSLSDNQIIEISELLSNLNIKLGKPQDIEFAYENNELFLLQTRPVTAIYNQPKGEYTLWDNSNIIESYPGITSPLTFSFIIKMYEAVYRQFVGLLGLKEKEINKHSGIFANTLGLIRGRVYYNLLNWYKMLAMVPGYSVNAEFMENMMGVKEKFELKEDFRINKGVAKLRIITMIFKMFWLQFRLPAKRRKFMKHLEKVMSEYNSFDFGNFSVSELIKKYLIFEQTLLKKWKAPLINDFFAMIWFGTLQKMTEKYIPGDKTNIHNDLLCGSQDIISVEPIHRIIKISSLILKDESAKNLFLQKSESEILKELKKDFFLKFHLEIKNYIEKFGERCVGELKLETVSYSQKPELFIRILKSYVEQNITQINIKKNTENELRNNAENEVKKAFKGSFMKRKIFNLVLRKTRDLVSNRENLRYERTRGFGMVRKIFSEIGKKLAENEKIYHERDIFYLKLEEITDFTEGKSKINIKKLIYERKSEFEEYKKQEIPSERFFTYGNDFSDTFIYSQEKIEITDGDLKGIGACPGIVKNKVRIVKDPTEISSLNDEILVTSSTDPGWVTLFPTASGIIVERGSLLSHSAIVSREMGIPCIVSVPGLLRTLKSGDEVIMNGNTGEIKVLKNKKNH